MERILHDIAENHDLKITQVQSLTGGDINKVYLLKSETSSYVVKLNSALRFPRMFKTESKGLELLRSSKSFRIPKVEAFGDLENSSYLILEYIDTGKSNSNFWNDFAENLARLHRNSAKKFGLDHDNYIGSLIQKNSFENTASDFYINQRLQPQFEMARNNGYNFAGLEKFFRNITEEIPKESPSLVHGDLWNGNYLASIDGKPVLIDPAVAFAPREMDLAMMQLFGGFPAGVFEDYNALFPLSANWKRRIPIWQLYYLLVHLNLFGVGYLSQVRSIIEEFS